MFNLCIDRELLKSGLQSDIVSEGTVCAVNCAQNYYSVDEYCEMKCSRSRLFFVSREHIGNCDAFFAKIFSCPVKLWEDMSV